MSLLLDLLPGLSLIFSLHKFSIFTSLSTFIDNSLGITASHRLTGLKISNILLNPVIKLVHEMLYLVKVDFVVIDEVVEDVTSSGVVLIIAVLLFFTGFKVEVFLPYSRDILKFSRFNHNIDL